MKPLELCPAWYKEFVTEFPNVEALRLRLGFTVCREVIPHSCKQNNDLLNTNGKTICNKLKTYTSDTIARNISQPMEAVGANGMIQQRTD